MNGFEDKDYDKDFELKTWRKLFTYMGIHKGLIKRLAFVFVVLAFIDSAFPLMTMYAIDTFIIAGEMETLPIFTGIYLGLIGLFCLMIYFLVYWGGQLETGITYTLRQAAFRRLQELSYSFYDKTPVGYIMARMTADAERIGDTVAWSFMDIVWSITTIIIIVIVMLFVNPFLTLIALTTMPFMVAFSIFFRKLMLKNQRAIRKQNSKITAAFAEGINSARTTKTLVREKSNLQEFDGLTGEMHSLSIKSAVLSAAFWPIIISIANIGIGLVLWHGGQAALMEAISFGTLSLFIGYTMQMFDPIQEIARMFANIQAAQASAERTIDLIETKPDITDTDEAVEKYGDLLNPKPANWPAITGAIEFKDVAFNYAEGEQVLENFNLKVAPGEKIALIGETGAGKSTIINLLCRFYEPVSGAVFIDGVDYRKYSQIWLQSNLGYVLQSPHLFSGTIEENIRYGKPHATQEEVEQAAKAVNAYDFIISLPEGFNAEVGEGGTKLSAGERQLISFARAILKDPKIFVLDEATASVDTVTESIIQQAVDKILQGRTSFIVAHRLSTIRSCDRILVINTGKIVEEGNHKTLLEKRGYYYNLYSNQFRDEVKARLLGEKG